MNDSNLTQGQTDLGEALRADAVLGAVPVLDEELGDLESQVGISLGLLEGAAATGGKAGACIIILSPVGNDEAPDCAGAGLDVDVGARILVNPFINNDATIGTGLKALTLARRVHRVMKGLFVRGVFNPLVPDRPSIVPVESDFAPVAYDVRFKAIETDNTAYLKVVLPTITATGTTPNISVTLACNTSGASIYYTTDGSFPRSGNATAHLYSAPFVVATGVTIRTVGYKTGYLGSDLNAIDV